MNTTSFRSVALACRGQTIEVSYFIRQGPGGAILYLHGLGSTKYDLLPATYLPTFDKHTIVALDFPGSGSTPYPEETNLSIDDLVELAQRFAEHLQLEDVTLIGHSMGGLVGLLVALQRPRWITRFVDVEGNLAPEDCGVFSRITASLSYSEGAIASHRRRLQEEFSRLPFIGARIFADRFLDDVTERAFYDYCVSIVQRTDEGDLLAAFESMGIPRLFVHGSANAHLSYIGDLDEHGAGVAEIANSHHWPHLDNPVEYYRAIREFMCR